MQFGSRNLLISHQNYLNSKTPLLKDNVDNWKEEPSEQFVNRICQQAKLISQLISFIWLWSDKPESDNDKLTNYKISVAQSLKKIFYNPKKEHLMKLLTTDPFSDLSDLNLSDFSDSGLLKTVFAQYSKEQKKTLFPIFSEYEQKRYAVSVDVERFHGQVGDPTLNNPGILSFTIPYPPRPQLGKATVSEEELDEWLKNTKIDQFTADNPYIPTSCS